MPKNTKGVINADEQSSRKSGLPDPCDETGTMFALVTKSLGNGGFICRIISEPGKSIIKVLKKFHNYSNKDSVLKATLRGGIRRGKGKYLNFVKPGESVVLLEVPKYNVSRCIILGVYTRKDITKYIKQGLIPRNYMENTNEHIMDDGFDYQEDLPIDFDEL